MPKKNSLDIPQEKILMEEELTPEETQPIQAIITKPHRQVSDFRCSKRIFK